MCACETWYDFETISMIKLQYSDINEKKKFIY